LGRGEKEGDESELLLLLSLLIHINYTHLIINSREILFNPQPKRIIKILPATDKNREPFTTGKVTAPGNITTARDATPDSFGTDRERDEERGASSAF
jgi:hypothetical protein